MTWRDYHTGPGGLEDNKEIHNHETRHDNPKLPDLVSQEKPTSTEANEIRTLRPNPDRGYPVHMTRHLAKDSCVRRSEGTTEHDKTASKHRPFDCLNTRTQVQLPRSAYLTYAWNCATAELPCKYTNKPWRNIIGRLFETERGNIINTGRVEWRYSPQAKEMSRAVLHYLTTTLALKGVAGVIIVGLSICDKLGCK
ncbi:hypothetical protein BU15DRAFT_67449 [Melanogaster broomeanus]|nr:hypothetical protein BU15DRAFT_67449 [Melanogaster broomeanus]